MNRTVNIQSLTGNIKSAGWSAIREAILSFLRTVMEAVFSCEQQEQIGCQPYERSTARRDYANGTYQRLLSTSYGVINDLKIPRLRRHPFSSRLLQRYKRRAVELDRALLVWYLQGESCRDVTRSLYNWAQDILSAQSVSRLLPDHRPAVAAVARTSLASNPCRCLVGWLQCPSSSQAQGAFLHDLSGSRTPW